MKHEFQFKMREGPREITDPKIKRKLLKSAYTSLKEFEHAQRNIKILIYRLYRFYPKHTKMGVAWIKTILPEEDMKSYVEQGILVQSKDGQLVGLGPNGLILISMWNTERLTKWVIGLTILASIFGVLSLIISYVNIKNF